MSAPVDIDTLIAKETLMISLLSLTIVLGVLLRMLHKRFGVRTFLILDLLDSPPVRARHHPGL